MNQLKSAIKQTNIQLLTITLVTIGVYINSLFNGLVWDDHLFLESWPDIRSTAGISNIFKGSAPPAQDKIYRPIRGFFYVVDWQIFGASPFGYHLQAILIHLSITTLVFLIVREIVSGQLSSRAKRGDLSREIASSTSSPRNDSFKWLPFAVALIFGIHPIHTETISYIAASMETWGTLFFFGAFAAYLYANDMRIKLVRMDANVRMLLMVVSVILALLAFFTYEMTLTLPLLLILTELTLIKHRLKLISADKVKSVLFKSAPYFLAVGLYLFVRFFVLHIASRTDYLAYSFYHTMLVMVKVFLQYILLLLVPIGQTAIHNLVGDFPSSMTPYDKLDPILSQTIFDFDVLAAIVALILLVLIAIRLFGKFPVITFAIFWFLIALLPVSYIIPPGGAMAEKYLYIASFGVILGVVYGITLISADIKLISADVFKQAVVYLGVGVVVFYGVSTVARNAVWKNDITLFSDVVKKAPKNLLANYTLGIRYGNVGQLDAAVAHYKQVLLVAPEFWEARYNLANIYLKTANYDLAKNEYIDVLKVNTKFRAAQNILDNMDIVKSQQEATTSAVLGDELFTSYKKIKGLSFMFPVYWALAAQKDQVILSDSASDFKVEISEPLKFSDKSADDYLKRQKETFGTLLNEGQAQIPNVDTAWVKVWEAPISTDEKQMSTDSAKPAQTNQVIKLQFFLFKGNQIVQIFAYPVIGQMQTFDLILGSIRIE